MCTEELYSHEKKVYKKRALRVPKFLYFVQ